MNHEVKEDMSAQRQKKRLVESPPAIGKSDEINRLALAQVVSWSECTGPALLDAPPQLIIANLLHSSGDARMNDLGLSEAVATVRAKKARNIQARERASRQTGIPPQPTPSSAGMSRDEATRLAREEAKKALKRKFAKKNCS